VASNRTVLEVDYFEVQGTLNDLTGIAPPVGLTAADKPADQGGVLNLNWTANAEADLAGYNIFRATMPSGPYSCVAQVGKVTSYADVGLACNSDYYYKIAALDDSGNQSTYSNTVSARAIDNIAPGAPTGVAAADTPADVGGSINVSWVGNSEPDLASYRVYRATAVNGSYTKVADVSGATSSTDTGRVNGTDYFYKVAAVDSHGNASAMSAAASSFAHDDRDFVAPAVPTDVMVADTAGDATGKLSVTWTAVSASDFTAYRVYRASQAGGPYTRVAQVSVPVFVDQGRPNVQTFYYVITACDSAGNESQKSAEGSGFAKSDETAPGSVPGLSGLPSNTFVSLAWQPATDNAVVAGYEVWMKVGAAGAYELQAGLPGTAYTKLGLTNGVQYYFKVRAKDTSGNLGSFSEEQVLAPVAGTGGSIVTRIEDSDPAIVYSGEWSTDVSPNYYGNFYSGGTTHYTLNAGDYAQLTFSGTGVSLKWYGSYRENRCMANVFVDGSFVTMVDLYSPTEVQSVLYSVTGLSDGQHTIKIVNTGLNNPDSNRIVLDVDCFDVTHD
jgi:fibronectin type 3 domain-containing protein